jgi:hypothetical protein
MNWQSLVTEDTSKNFNCKRHPAVTLITKMISLLPTQVGNGSDTAWH